MGNSGDEFTGIGVQRLAKQAVDLAVFHDLTGAQYRNALRDTPHRRQVVGDKQIGQPQLLLELLGAPLLATTLILPDETEPLNDPDDIREQLQHLVDGIVDAGACPLQPTTVLDLVPMASGDEPMVVREGRGSLQALGL